MNSFTTVTNTVTAVATVGVLLEEADEVFTMVHKDEVSLICPYLCSLAWKLVELISRMLGVMIKQIKLGI
jgi:hypothetical protein